MLESRLHVSNLYSVFKACVVGHRAVMRLALILNGIIWLVDENILPQGFSDYSKAVVKHLGFSCITNLLMLDCSTR